MKTAAGFSFVLAIAMVLNAIDGKWAFVRSHHGSQWVVLDLVIAAGFVVASYLLWRTARRREYERYAVLAEQLDREDPEWFEKIEQGNR